MTAGSDAAAQPDEAIPKVPAKAVILNCMYDSLLVFALTNARKMAREGLLTDTSKILQDPPYSRSALVRCYREASKEIVAANGKRGTAIADFVKVLEAAPPDILGDDRVEILILNDENHQEQCVYSITVYDHLKMIILAFRGTWTNAEWLVNLDLRLVVLNDSNVAVHAGFYSYIFSHLKDGKRTVYDYLIPQLQRLREKHPDYGLVVTGYSLGAALATLFTYYYCTQLKDSEKYARHTHCVAMGSPRIGNLQFYRACKGLNLCRVSLRDDIITKIPDRLHLCSFFRPRFFFRHVPSLEVLFLEEDARNKEDPNYQCRLNLNEDKGWFLPQIWHDTFKGGSRACRITLYCCSCCCCQPNYSLMSGIHRHHIRTYDVILRPEIAKWDDDFTFGELWKQGKPVST